MLLKTQDWVGGRNQSGQGDALQNSVPPLLMLGFCCISSLQTFLVTQLVHLWGERQRVLMMQQHQTVAVVPAGFSPSLVLRLQCWWEPQAN